MVSSSGAAGALDSPYIIQISTDPSCGREGKQSRHAPVSKPIPYRINRSGTAWGNKSLHEETSRTNRTGGTAPYKKFSRCTARQMRPDVFYGRGDQRHAARTVRIRSFGGHFKLCARYTWVLASRPCSHGLLPAVRERPRDALNRSE